MREKEETVNTDERKERPNVVDKEESKIERM